MKITRISTAVASLVVATGVLASSAAASPRTSRCGFTVTLPAVIGMSQSVQSIPTRLAVNCPTAASYSLDIEFKGQDSYNSAVTLGRPRYTEAGPSVALQLTSCNGPDLGNNGHYAGRLLSADVRDAQSNAVPDVQVVMNSTVVVNSALIYAASSRQGSAVYLNGLQKSYGFYTFGQPPSMGFGCGLSRQAGTVYLQRLLNGAWQTMLTRDTAADGTVTVGFVQPAVYQYRWVVLSSPAEPAGSSGYPSGLVGANSASTVR